MEPFRLYGGVHRATVPSVNSFTRQEEAAHVSGRAGGAFVPQFALVMPVCLAPASCRSHGCTHCRMFAIHP